ncbi:MAG: DegT/DnrJ/EryC1/StrS aminotransferase family protein [Magnetococcales bacterium]|nr:DegT/DnrJ/EryC1/StrS aminotransferase family protein [Magnetococcales bacterium]
MTRNVQAVPLVRADLTCDDARAVRRQMAIAPFQDAALLDRWEAAWETLWHRSAVAFAEPTELVQALKTVMGWQAGDRLGVDPLLDPVWMEAMAAAWLQPAWRDVHPVSGQGRGDFVGHGPTTGPLRAGLCQHAFGMRAGGERVPGVPFWLEDLSARPLPTAGCGWGDLQLLYFSGNGMVAAGSSCLLLTRDEALGDRLRQLRRHPPAALACALGLSQLSSLTQRLARRQALAERYRHLLRGQAAFQLPDDGNGERVWEMFLLTMSSNAGWLGLKTFLHKSHLHADSPLWYKPANAPPLAGLSQFRARTLAIPLYAALTEPEQKHLINRINRWVARQEKQRVTGEEQPNGESYESI